MKKDKENDSKFKNIVKRILAFLGVATTVALPTGIAVERNKNEKTEGTTSSIIEESEAWTEQLDFGRRRDYKRKCGKF